MTVRMKLTLILGALVSANLAIYGARVLFSASIDPILRALGA